MSKFHSRSIYTLSVLLLFVLLGGPQLAQAWPLPQQEPQQNAISNRPAPEAVPDAPSATQQEQQPAKTNKKDKNPLGAAAAEAGVTAGGAASRPAGSALAPAKQGQRR